MYFGILVIARILFFKMMNTPVCFYCFIILIRFMYKAICSIFQWRLTEKGRNCIYLEFYYNIAVLDPWKATMLHLHFLSTSSS